MVANAKSRSSIEYLSGIDEMVAIDYSGGDVTLATIPRSLSCNAAGNVVMRMAKGSTDVTRYMNAGVDYPWAVKIIRQTNTTATGLVAGY